MNSKIGTALVCTIPVVAGAGFWIGRIQRPVVQVPCPQPVTVSAPAYRWSRPASPPTILASRIKSRQVEVNAKCLCMLDPHSARFLADAYEAQTDEGLEGLYRRGAAVALDQGTWVTITTPDDFKDGFPTSGFDEIRVRAGEQIGQECYVMRGFLK